MWCGDWSSSSTFDDFEPDGFHPDGFHPDGFAFPGNNNTYNTTTTNQAQDAMTGEQKPNAAVAAAAAAATADTTKTKTENEREAANKIDDLTELMFTLWKNKEKEQRRSSSGYSPDTTTSSTTSSSCSNKFSHSLFGSSVSGTAFTRTVDKTWSRELYEMNHDDRIRVSNELHGVAYSKNYLENQDDDDETTTRPEFIHLSLIAMDLEIENNESIPINKKRGHQRAIELHNRRYNHSHNSGSDSDDDHYCYVRSKYFRMRFLRADKFDPKKASERYCKSLNVLLRFFGDNALLRQLNVNDLDKDELKFLREGHLQLLPSRDRGGRRILVSMAGNYNDTVRPKVELFLVFGVLGEDITTQIKGFVLVHIFGFGSYEHDDIEYNFSSIENYRRMYHEIFEALPVNPDIAIHLCFPAKPLYNFSKAMFLAFMGTKYRERIRIHTGSQMETIYSLGSFGIIVEDVPITVTGTIKTKNAAGFVKARRAIDKFRQERCEQIQTTFTSEDAPGIECPEVNCVIFGVGRFHPNNIEFREILGLMEDRFVAVNATGGVDDAIDSTTDPATIRDGVDGNNNNNNNNNSNNEDNNNNAQPHDNSAKNINTSGGINSSNNKQQMKLQKTKLIDEIVDMTMKRFVFCFYEKEFNWYKMIDDRSHVRIRISQCLRDNRRQVMASERKKRKSSGSTTESALKKDKDSGGGVIVGVGVGIGVDVGGENESGECSNESKEQ